jgi:hypothetical protein
MIDTVIITHREPTPFPATMHEHCPAGCDSTPVVDSTHDRCPGCADLIRAQLQVLAERLADVAKVPDLMLVCGGCQRTFVIAPSLARKAAR